jgi:hypothetical protein
MTLKCTFLVAALLRFENSAKADLASEGWILDEQGHFGPVSSNAGWISRRNIFIDSKDEVEGTADKWKQYDTPVFGFLSTDFDSVKKPLAPNVPFQVTINW